jgi:hypothetical protein
MIQIPESETKPYLKPGTGAGSRWKNLGAWMIFFHLWKAQGSDKILIPGELAAGGGSWSTGGSKQRVQNQGIRLNSEHPLPGVQNL